MLLTRGILGDRAPSNVTLYLLSLTLGTAWHGFHGDSEHDCSLQVFVDTNIHACFILYDPDDWLLETRQNHCRQREQTLVFFLFLFFFLWRNYKMVHNRVGDSNIANMDHRYMKGTGVTLHIYLPPYTAATFANQCHVYVHACVMDMDVPISSISQ